MSMIRQLSVLVLAAVLSGAALARMDSGEDARLRHAVLSEIDAHPALRIYHIGVHSDNGVVYLEGIVGTRIDRNEARDVARSVPGVRKVYNDLTLARNGM